MAITTDKVNRRSAEKRIPSTVILSSLGVLLVATVLLMAATSLAETRDMSFAGQHTAIRRLDCSVFCRKTGFSGYVGGCQCGFTLFANKRSPLLQQSPLLRSRLLYSAQATPKVVYPETTNNNYMSDDDSSAEEGAAAVVEGPIVSRLQSGGKMADRPTGSLAGSR